MGCTTLRDGFVDSLILHGDRVAIRFLRRGRLETELSYRQLDRDSSRFANYLQAKGVQKGDRVILFFEKSLLFVIAHLALQKLGVTAVPLNPGFKASEMEYLVADADARLVLAGLEQKAIIQAIDPGLATVEMDSTKAYQDIGFFRSAPVRLPQVAVAPDDPALIIYTSGTTGNPKGAVLTHANLVHDAYKVIGAWEISARDVLCHALPLFHVHGLCFALHTTLLVGARVIMHDAFVPPLVLESLRVQEGADACTLFMAVPAMYSKLLPLAEEGKDRFDHVRLWTSGSAPLLPKEFQRIKQVLGKEPVEREGMSETGMNFSNPIHGLRKPGSIGLVLPGLQVRIVDPGSGQDVAPGTGGEFWLKGPGITPGYWRKPKETAEAFVDGWFRSGDLGYVDADGYYFLTDRLKHIIISGGENISPKEIETVINRLPDVLESCVVGVADEKWGEKVVAAVVTRKPGSLSAAQLTAHCKQQLHDWKCPKEWIFLDQLPRNTMGKVLKEEVEKLFIQRP